VVDGLALGAGGAVVGDVGVAGIVGTMAPVGLISGWGARRAIDPAVAPAAITVSALRHQEPATGPTRSLSAMHLS
jgi:hypothetical protein